MVGRDLQLRMLLEAFEAVTTEDACHLFTVMGPAGIGKSRLVREFVSTISGRAEVLTGRCLSYGEGITFWPIEEMALQAAGITEDASPEKARAELRRLLEDSPDGETVAAHLGGMLGLDGSGPVEPSLGGSALPGGARTATAGRRRLRRHHWGEPTLLEVIEHVAAWSREFVPILLVCMARPELLEERPGWGGGQRNATSVHLEPLSEPEADALIENLLGHPALTRDIRERIRAAANGNPLFVEEMLSMLVDEAILVQKDGQWVATVDLSTVQVPAAISALLASRLDRLSPDERRVVEAAAVVGEVFDHSAVAALVPEESGARLDVHLDRLLLKDVVRPVPRISAAAGGFVSATSCCGTRPTTRSPRLNEPRSTKRSPSTCKLPLPSGRRNSTSSSGYHLEQAHRMRDELGLHDKHTERLARSAFEHLRAAGLRAAERGTRRRLRPCSATRSTCATPTTPTDSMIAWVLGFALSDSGSIPEAREFLTDAIARAEVAGSDRAPPTPGARWRPSNCWGALRPTSRP
jgi:hypothetical protein